MNKNELNKLLLFAIDYNIYYGRKYKLNKEIVSPTLEDEDSFLGALGHGFVHYKNQKNQIKFCGIQYWKDNAKLINKLK